MQSRPRPIPATLRIGITGHRFYQGTPVNESLVLPGGKTLVAEVRNIIQSLQHDISSHLKTTPLVLAGISSLAEGADRLVAKEILQTDCAGETPQFQLHAVLPFPAEDFKKDFGDAASQAEFDDLLKQAVSVSVAGSGEVERPQGYVRSGVQVVENSDMLLAIVDPQREENLGPDGQPKPGGTLATVQHAKTLGRYVISVHPGTGQIEHCNRNALQNRIQHVFKPLDSFNDTAIDADKYDREISTMHAGLDRIARKAGLPEEPITRIAEKLLPHFVKADNIAQKCQRKHLLSTHTVYYLAPLAIAAAAVHALFMTESLLPVWLEAIILAAIISLVIIAHRCNWTHTWLDCRYLTESLRRAMNLRLAGLTAEGLRIPAHMELFKRTDHWTTLAFQRIWDDIGDIGQPFSESLKSFILESWIDDQAGYYRKRSRQLKTRHRGYYWAGISTFAFTLVVVFIHAVGLFHSQARLLTFLALALPALGASLAGIRAQRDFHQQADRYEAMASALQSVSDRMRRAESEDEFARHLRYVNQITALEHYEWRVILEYHKLEPPG